ncbi:MAG: hypothetical protein ABI693_13185 [Bryobacteraceae bacterium]
MATRKKPFEGEKEVKRIARKRVGTVPPGRPIVPKRDRKKPKHKTPPGEEA